MEIVFTATIKEISAKSLVSGDKSYRLLLESRDPRIMSLDSAQPYDELPFIAHIHGPEAQNKGFKACSNELSE